MRKAKIVLLLLIFVVATFVGACNGGSANNSSVSSGNENSSTVNNENSSVEDNQNSSSTNNDSSSSSSTQTPPDDEYEIITVAQALELCGEPGNTTTERYYLSVTVDSVTNPNFGAMVVSDEPGSISVYNSKNADGTVGYAEMEDKPYAGDSAILYCTLQNYNGNKEVKSAYIIEFEHAVIEDDGSYTQMTVENARNADVGDKVEITGVVAAITYANGKIPSGAYIVDGTSSIYAYGEFAGRVSKGDEITIRASKTYWILESEQTNASKYGYKGCNQLENVTLVSVNSAGNEFNKSWIEETTVKEIMETPVTEDITTLIYKVNALVKKVDGSNFVNYYFDDLDGFTGSYTYTQCNGSDFAWIDEFDGKICTVYLSVINAKSTATGCIYRFLPVEIIDENYTFNPADGGEFAVKYYGVDQFEETYNADPAKELVTEVSSELLGIEGATLSYNSSNTAIVYFEEENGVVVMHCGSNGKATVTVTGEYNGIQYSESVEVEVVKEDDIEALTVAQAIATAPDTNVTVRGFVGPSLFNQLGFYLFDSEGNFIAVKVNSAEEFEGLEIGHEVVLEGTRERYIKNDASTITGQTCIVNATIVLNLYGNNQYSTAKFVTDKTAQDFSTLANTVDYSTTVFVLDLTATLIDRGYFTQLEVKDANGTQIKLYMSGAGQYAFLKPYFGKQVKMEVAACNWNDKNYWAGCVIAVILEDGTKVYNTYNFDNN